MEKKTLVVLAVVTFILGMTGLSFAGVVDFTGGTATLSDSTTVTPNNNACWFNVDYYVEDGLKFDFIGDIGTIGTYEYANNDTLHGHWATGDFGSLTGILVTPLDGNPFSLLWFDLVTNTDTGGGAASGNERTWLTASNGYSKLLPPEDWGGTVTRIDLFANCLNVTWISFTVTNPVDCFGMDNFVTDIPEPATLLLLGLGGLLLRKK